MVMPYVKNDDVLVRYETFGDEMNLPLVLIFGISMTCEDWLELGYISGLAKEFHVVCVEPRGHGLSTCPTNSSSYALPKMASDIETVINTLDLVNPLVWGYSLGAKIALAAAVQNPEAYRGLILGGFELHSEVDLATDMVAETFSSGAQAWLAVWMQMFDVPDGMATRLARVNTNALHALRTAEAEWPPLGAASESFTAPVLLYAGEKCFFRNATAAAVAHFPSARYLERPGRNHFDLMPDSAWITGEVVQQFGSSR